MKLLHKSLTPGGGPAAFKVIPEEARFGGTSLPYYRGNEPAVLQGERACAKPSGAPSAAVEQSSAVEQIRAVEQKRAVKQNHADKLTNRSTLASCSASKVCQGFIDFSIGLAWQ